MVKRNRKLEKGSLSPMSAVRAECGVAKVALAKTAIMRRVLMVMYVAMEVLGD